MNKNSKIIKKLKFIYYRLFFDFPEKKWFRLFIYRMWLLLGMTGMVILLLGKLNNIPPPYNELQCDQGVIVEIKASRWRSHTNVIKLETGDGNIKKYIHGAWDEDIPLLQTVIGKNVSVCFYPEHPYMSDLKYGEVIYDGERVLNNYESRSEVVAERLHQSNRSIPGAFFTCILLPLLLLVIFVIKNKNIYWKWSKEL